MFKNKDLGRCKAGGYSNRGDSLWVRRWVKLLRKTLRTKRWPNNLLVE